MKHNFEWAISELPFASISKRVYVRNHSYENEFHLRVHFHPNQAHFHLNGFARRLVLKQRQRVTRKWPIERIPPFILKEKVITSRSTASFGDSLCKYDPERAMEMDDTL